MATIEILLISEAFLKENSTISENTAGRFCRSAIREAQEVKYRGIVGDTLLDVLKAKVADGSIKDDGNAAYRELLEKSRYFLMYSALVELLPKVNYKVANAGLVSTPDEKVAVAYNDIMIQEQDRYQGKADHQALLLQNYLLNNSGDFPELDEGECHRIKSNLYSAATSGVFLGGARGRRIINPAK